MPKITVSYSDKLKGWTAFHTYEPDMFLKLNNRFFTIKDGQLYLHNDQDNPQRNVFYEDEQNSKITTVINIENSEDKIFKTMVLEGTHPWETKLKTNLTNSTIHANEYNKRESRFFAHVRGNEMLGNLHGNTAQGIGVIVSITGTSIVFSIVPDLISIGDVLHQINGNNQEVIGTITIIDRLVNTITVDAIITTPIIGLYSYALKNSRAEGEEIRGYFMEIELENSDNTPVELFAIESNVIKSYV